MKASIMIVIAIAALTSILMFGCCRTCCSSCKGGDGIRKLSTPEMITALAEKPAPILVDARGNKPDMEMIPGAIALSYDAPDQVIMDTLKDKNATVITYCANVRCSASPTLAKRLMKMGYTNVREYPEGIAGWKARPMTK